MLKPYIIAVCERVIIDPNGIASLIELFNGIEVRKFPGGPETLPPSNAVVPKQWSIFTSWEFEPEDAPKKFRQFFKVLYPNDAVWVEEAVEFTTEVGKDHQQVTGTFMGFPIGQQGTYKVTVRLEHDGVTVFESPAIGIKVKHLLDERATSAP